MKTEYWKKCKDNAEYSGFVFHDLVEVAKVLKKLEIDNVEYLRLMLDKNEMFFVYFLSENNQDHLKR